MASHFEWRGQQAKKHVSDVFLKRLERAAITLKNEIKKVISEPSGKGSTPSSPGEPPHKDTGRLRASISHEVDATEKTARVGTNVNYGKFLELGTKKMAPRPFIRPTFEKLKARLQEILRGN